jgi:MerR family transcriptional regulator, copper efflux regulator
MDSTGIGTLAKRAGVRIDTVRYYERNGLLTPRARLASGYRPYGELEVSRLRFIRRAQVVARSSWRTQTDTLMRTVRA